MKRPRPALFVALVLAISFGARSAWIRSHRAARTVATTTCPFFGEPVVTMVGDMQPWDTMPARVHEEVHAAQCRELGPVKIRLRNLTSAGKLALEAPAFCAAAVARLRVDPDSAYVNERLHSDMIEGLVEVADSLAIKASLMSTCPAIASGPRGFKPRPKRVASPRPPA